MQFCAESFASFRCGFLFSITATSHQVLHTKGVFGMVNAYFGVVESQGWGSLHLHMLLWLKDTPSMDEMEHLLKAQDFQEQPGSADYEHQLAQFERHVARAKQLHTLTRNGRVVCKRWAPFPVSKEDYVEENDQQNSPYPSQNWTELASFQQQASGSIFVRTEANVVVWCTKTFCKGEG
ncbi:hypothetical protein EDD16DRAFT_1796410 [Pisolithus croceorrhizus]|nr:hypothetical protein EDD16DRAFT_1796410 [Pisolithus croceorrhizus]